MLRGLLIAFVGLLMLSSTDDQLDFGLPMNMSVVRRAGVGGKLPSRVHPIGVRTIGRKLQPHFFFAAPSGEAVAAIGKGKVIEVSYEANGFGNVVVVQHNDSVTSTYAHLSRSAVSNGQQLHKGQLLGFVGSTGLSSAPHLALYLKVNGEVVHPYRFFPRDRLPSKFDK